MMTHREHKLVCIHCFGDVTPVENPAPSNPHWTHDDLDYHQGYGHHSVLALTKAPLLMSV